MKTTLNLLFAILVFIFTQIGTAFAVDDFDVANCEIIIRSQGKVKLALADDPLAKVDSNGNFHYTLPAKCFSPNISVMDVKNIEKERFVKLIHDFIVGMGKLDLKSVEPLFDPETAKEIYELLETPEASAEMAKRYAKLRRYEALFVIKIEKRYIVFSRMETAAAPHPGYPYLGFVKKNNILYLTYLNVDEKIESLVDNIVLGLQNNTLEIKPVKQ